MKITVIKSSRHLSVTVAERREAYRRQQAGTTDRDKRTEAGGGKQRGERQRGEAERARDRTWNDAKKGLGFRVQGSGFRV